MDKYPKNNQRFSYGFTLIEVLITMAIIGILLNVGIVSYGQLIDGTQNRKTTDNLKAALAQTRSESIVRGGNVMFCGSSDGITCTNNFNDGWVIYYDKDTSATLTSDDIVITSHDVDYTGTQIVATDSSGSETIQFGFNYRGYPVMPVTLDVSGRAESSTIQLYANGRVEIQ